MQTPLWPAQRTNSLLNWISTVPYLAILIYICAQRCSWRHTSLMAMQFGRQGERTLNLLSTVLPQFHTLKFSLYSAVCYTNRTYGYTGYLYLGISYHVFGSLMEDGRIKPEYPSTGYIIKISLWIAQEQVDNLKRSPHIENKSWFSNLKISALNGEWVLSIREPILGFSAPFWGDGTWVTSSATL